MTGNRHEKIDVDFREKAETLINILKSSYEIEINMIALKYGDYFIPPDTVVERKTTYDFLISIIDGRLFKQAYRLAEHCKRPILLIEGETFFGEKYPDVSKEAIKGALITIAQTFYIPVLRTTSESDTAWYINKLYEHRQRIGENSGPLLSHKARRTDTQKIRFLKALPGVGSKSAKTLLQHFGSIKNIVNASEKELLDISGIGKKTASKIQDVLNSTVESLVNSD